MSTTKFGLADLTNSVFNSLELPGTQDTLAISASAMRECIILIDGMGKDAIDKFGDQFSVFSQIKFFKSLYAIFPSTTVTSLSTFGTGVLPGVHGMLGYTVKVPRSDNRLLNAFQWDERVDPIIWQRVPTFFERAAKHSISVTYVAAKRYEGSGFTQAALRGAKYVGVNGVADMAAAVGQALVNKPAFVYTYLNTLDSAGHSDGVGSDKWLTALKQVNDFISRVIQVAPNGTRIWITSDHGMVNSTQQTILGQGNDLLENVILIGGEPRARHIYLKAGSEAETVSAWREFFGSSVKVLSKSEAISTNLFGEIVLEDSFERMGDLIAIANDDLILIDPARIKEETSMVGHHGGTTAVEVEIPLLLA